MLAENQFQCESLGLPNSNLWNMLYWFEALPCTSAMDSSTFMTSLTSQLYCSKICFIMHWKLCFSSKEYVCSPLKRKNWSRRLKKLQGSKLDKGIYGYANTFIQIYEYNIGKAWTLRKCRFCLVLGQGNLLNNETYSDSTAQDGGSCRTGRCSTCSRCSTRSTSVRRRWIAKDVRCFNKMDHIMAFLLLPYCILILAKFMFSKVVFLPCFCNSREHPAHPAHFFKNIATFIS